MKIVFMETDTLGSDVDLSMFAEFGDVTMYNRSEPDKNADRIKDADIIIVNKIPVNESLLKDAASVKLICLSATGTNNIDFEYTKKRGIKVANARGYSTDSVAQHTFAMFFYLYEKLRKYDEFVKSGDYSNYHMFSCFEPHFNELSNKTWGIIGLGAIGHKVAEIARAFGCKIIYYSASGNIYDCDYEHREFDSFLKESDIVSIHCPLTDVTKNLIDSRALSYMRSSAILLNLARGPIVCEQALADALNSGTIAAAGLDVMCTEPLPSNSPLINIKDSSRILITPHMAWGTCEARQRCVNEVFKNIKAYTEGTDRNIV
ncbi:MAG: D-2-hydroxyacid dehydrogenase [Lachnospiraceae bacterium]|nr:D-2-hydroxyacid dehydrogenase [Lachnospiraceae bacterium]